MESTYTFKIQIFIVKGFNRNWVINLVGWTCDNVALEVLYLLHIIRNKEERNNFHVYKTSFPMEKFLRSKINICSIIDKYCTV
jgi:hypothetical protein